MREITQDYAGLVVTEMTRTACELWDWKRSNGRLKELEFRQLLQYLEAPGWSKLPSVRPLGPRGPRQSQLTAASHSGKEGAAFEPWSCGWSRTRKQSRQWKELIERHLVTARPDSDGGVGQAVHSHGLARVRYEFTVSEAEIGLP